MQTTQQLLQTVIDNLDEIAARGDFADAPSYITDALDKAQTLANQAQGWLEYDAAPCMSRDDWQPALGSAQSGSAA